MVNSANSLEQGINMSAEGQKIMNMIVESKKPVVAAINGSCLGGGLEVVFFF